MVMGVKLWVLNFGLLPLFHCFYNHQHVVFAYGYASVTTLIIFILIVLLIVVTIVVIMTIIIVVVVLIIIKYKMR